jgi:hypothetical protein
MHQRHMHAGAKQFERRLGRRILAADHDDTLTVVRVCIGVIVRDVRQIFARDTEVVWQVVIADRQHHGSRVPFASDTAMRCRHGEHAVIAAFDLGDGLVIRDRNVVGVDDAAVIAQRFEARRLVVRRGQGQATDLEQFRRGEEHHVHREVEDRIDQHTFLDDGEVEPVALGGDRGSQSRGTSADDDDVSNRHG